MNENLRTLLEYLLVVLDSERQEMVEDLHRRTLDWETVERLPVIMTLPMPQELRFSPYPHNEMFKDPEKMLFNELVYAFNTSIASRDVLGDDLPCTIRANFGTVVIASMFGAHAEQLDDNPPWIRHGEDDITLESILDQDPLDSARGWCPRVMETYEFYQSILRDYPELQRLVKMVLPDLQGPFDNLELIFGSRLFTELYMNPDIVDKALTAMATAQIGLAKKLATYVTDGPDGFSHQHATMTKGKILLRNDSVIMMSPQMYRDRIAHHDQRVLSELGGGGIHSCGKVDSHVLSFLELPSIQCIDLGQSELNDIDGLIKQLRQHRIALTRLKVSRDDLATARITDKFPTGVSLLYQAESVRDAKETMETYLRSTEQQNAGNMNE